MKAKIHTERASKDELHAAKHATEARKVAEMLKRPNCAWNSAAISCSSPLRSIPSPATHQKPSAHTCVCAPLAHRCSASCALLFDVEMRASSDQHGRHPSTFSTMSRSASRIALKQAADKSTSMSELAKLNPSARLQHVATIVTTNLSPGAAPCGQRALHAHLTCSNHASRLTITCISVGMTRMMKTTLTCTCMRS